MAFWESKLNYYNKEEIMTKDYRMMSSDEFEEEIERQLDFYNRTRRMVSDIEYENFAVTYNEDIKQRTPKTLIEGLLGAKRATEIEEEEYFKACEEFEKKARQLTLKEKQAVEQLDQSGKWMFLKDSAHSDYFIAVNKYYPTEKILVKRI